MKAVILNASAWMIVPFMDALAKYLSSSMDVLQITWARYFFTVVFALSIMLFFDRKSMVWSKKPMLQLIRGLIFVFSTYLFFFAISEISLPKAANVAKLISINPGLITIKVPINPMDTAVHLLRPTFSFKKKGAIAVTHIGATNANVSAFGNEISEIA